MQEFGQKISNLWMERGVAAAIRSGAQAIVTFNLRDFPKETIVGFGVEAVHPDDFVGDLLDLAPGAVRDTKALIAGPQREAVQAAIAREGEIFGARLRSPEAMEAFQAFFQKRAPDFSKFD